MKFKKKDICEADSSSLISIQILVKKNNHKIILCSLHTIELFVEYKISIQCL